MTGSLDSLPSLMEDAVLLGAKIDPAGELGAVEEQIVVHEEVVRTRKELVKGIKVKRAEIRILLCYCYLAILTMWLWAVDPLIKLYMPRCPRIRFLILTLNFVLYAMFLFWVVWTFVEKVFYRFALKSNDRLAYHEKESWKRLSIETLRQWNRRLTVQEILCCVYFIFLSGFEIGMLFMKYVNCLIPITSMVEAYGNWTNASSNDFVQLTLSYNMTEMIS
ncbi:unnamed protein product [Caenorhabditis brenneri]